jgi:hypothetical protein
MMFRIIEWECRISNVECRVLSAISGSLTPRPQSHEEETQGLVEQYLAFFAPFVPSPPTS